MYNTNLNTAYIILHFVAFTIGNVQAQNYNKPRNNYSVLAMTAWQFEEIITSTKPFKFVGDGYDGRNDNVLNTFQRFLLTFDFANQTDPSYVHLTWILQLTAQYNQKHSISDTRNYVDLIIAMIPNGNITEKTHLVSAKIKETNSLFPGTVSAFVLHYRYQLLDSGSILLMNQDINMASQVLSWTQPLLTFGIILNSENCKTHNHKFRELDLRSVDMVIYMSNAYRETQSQEQLSSLHACFFTHAFTILLLNLRLNPIIFGLMAYSPTALNLEKKTFSFDRKELEAISYTVSQQDVGNSIVVLDINEVNSTDNHLQDPEFKSQEAQKNWLRKDSYFDREFTGISVYSNFKTVDTKLLFPQIMNKFCKVIVHQRETAQDSVENFQRITKNLFVEMATRRCRNERGEILNEIVLVTNTFQEINDPKFFNINSNVTSTVTTIAKNAASINGSIRMTVMLNWNACLKKENCDVLQTLRPVLGNGHGGQILLGPFLAQAKMMVADLEIEKRPRIGFIVELDYCQSLLWTNRDIINNSISDVFGLKVYVHKQRIVEQGALSASTEIIESFRKCSLLLNTHQYAQELAGHYANYIIIYGCDPYSSNINELKEITRFWELVSRWAVAIRTRVFIASAVEEALGVGSSISKSCSIDNAYSSKESCDCGWWRAVSKEQDATESNFVLEDKKSIALKLLQQNTMKPKISKDDDSLSNMLFKILIPTIIFVMIVVSVAVALIIRYRLMHRMSRQEAERLFNGRHVKQDDNDCQDATMDKMKTLNSAEYQRYDRNSYEVPRSHFKIDTSKLLGSGEFGLVCHGTVIRDNIQINVAVKTVKKIGGTDRNHGNFLAMKGLVSEIKILSYIGHHQNVVQFVGAYTEKLKIGKLMVFLELCELGSLFNFLRKCYTENQRMIEENDAIPDEKPQISRSTTLPPELCQDMHRWSFEIACGMEFISSKNMVHADLATRNVLLNASKCAKISDFGLSRRLYDYTEYTKQEDGPLPWRWMAPESLKRLVFDEKTDAWAYGVTLWEIFTLGDEPYPGLTWQVNFPAMLERGLRLEQPRYNNKDIYSLMKQCWKIDPSNRASFSGILSVLTKNESDDRLDMFAWDKRQ